MTDVFEQPGRRPSQPRARAATGRRFEILNFGVDGYSLPQQVAHPRGPRLRVLARHRHRHALRRQPRDDRGDASSRSSIRRSRCRCRRSGGSSTTRVCWRSGHVGGSGALRGATACGRAPSACPPACPMARRGRGRERAADDVLRTSFQRFAELTRAQGVTAARPGPERRRRRGAGGRADARRHRAGRREGPRPVRLSTR